MCQIGPGNEDRHETKAHEVHGVVSKTIVMSVLKGEKQSARQVGDFLLPYWTPNTLGLCHVSLTLV